MHCLDENTLTALAHGYLGTDALGQAERHLDACPECRWLLAELAQPEGREPWHAGGAPVWQAGDAVGRYVVIERIGSGGMGVVYAAYDPTLDRRVALKQLRRRWVRAEQAALLQDRLRREAQAMARLSHPSVLPVHDVGVADGQLYLVMELAAGTLRAWLHDAPRSVPDIVAAFTAAGEGLRAAHRAGLLHCDFKPDNVLRGPDGRIRVGDFGLARLADLDTESMKDAGTTGEPRTQSGTPAYLAPEQLRGAPASPQTDQWSFCVSLYEALYDALPFPGGTIEALRQAVQTQPLRLPPMRALPASVRRVLQRGLAKQPAARFASMDALLKQLTRRPWQRLRRLAAVGVGLALVGALAWAGTLLTRRPLAACRVAAEQATPLFASAQRALAAHPRMPQRIASLLDEYRPRWQAAMLEACTAARVRHEQAETTYQLRAACLQEHLAALRTLTELIESTGPAADSLVSSAQALGSIRRCDALRVLSARGEPPAPAVAADVTAQRARLAQAAVLLHAGAYERCAGLTADIQRHAQRLNHPPLRAEVLLLQARLALATQTPARSEPAVKEALWAAQEARHDEAAAQAWLLRVASLAAQPDRRAEAQKWLAHARAALERLGGDETLEASLAVLQTRLQP